MFADPSPDAWGGSKCDPGASLPPLSPGYWEQGVWWICPGVQLVPDRANLLSLYGCHDMSYHVSNNQAAVARASLLNPGRNRRHLVGGPPTFFSWVDSPGGTTNAAVAASGFSDDRLYLVGKGISESKVYYKMYDVATPTEGDATPWPDSLKGWNANWSEPHTNSMWTNLSPAATSFPGTTDYLYLFAVSSSSNEIFYTRKYALGSFSAWQRIANGGTTTYPVSAIAFNGQLYVFSVGTGNKRIYVNRASDGVNFQGPMEVGGNGFTNAAVSPAVYVVGGVPYLYLFMKDWTTGRIYWNRTTSGVNWNASWTEVGGSGVTNVGVSASVVKYRAYNELFLFAVGTGNTLYFNKSSDGVNWRAYWEEVAPVGNTSLPVGVSTFRNWLHIFKVDPVSGVIRRTVG